MTDQRLFHADSSYFYPHVRLTSEPLKTNTVSNTAYRGFGGPQGMVGGERMIEEIAYALGKDPLEIRKRNFYGDETDGRNVTPYHQTVTDNIIAKLVDELEESADYQARRAAILDFNRTSRVIRKGIALTPVKFGISFTMTAFNQAGALVHVYQDGSIHLNHGGTEMGQGLYTKVAQVLADSFQVDIDRVKITATTTAKVPNTSATAASSGSDLNGMAAYDAARQIKDRLIAFAAERWQTTPEAVLSFVPNHVQDRRGAGALPRFHQARLFRPHPALGCRLLQDAEDPLGSQTPAAACPSTTSPMGASCSEVSIDTLTGEYMVERVDVLHDVGKSLNPAIDIGQWKAPSCRAWAG